MSIHNDDQRFARWARWHLIPMAADVAKDLRRQHLALPKDAEARIAASMRRTLDALDPPIVDALTAHLDEMRAFSARHHQVVVCPARRPHLKLAMTYTKKAGEVVITDQRTGRKVREH